MCRLLSLTFLVLFVIATSCATNDVHYLKVGTGPQVGVYYTLGAAISAFVNQEENSADTSRPRLDMAVESTAGSVFNINAVASGALDFGFTQADRLYQSVNGIGNWQNNPQDTIRFICSFHPEMVTVVAADDSLITSLQDMLGKHVSLGPPGSGSRGNAIDILRFVGIEQDDFIAENLSVTNASLLLQDRRLDAFFYTVGHPNGSILEATNGLHPVHFVALEELNALITQFPYYFKTKIPITYYPQVRNKEDVITLGVLTCFVTSSNVSVDVVYRVVKSLFDHIDEFKNKHPAFKELTPEKMMQGAFAPLHPGAKKYFKEKNWL